MQVMIKMAVSILYETITTSYKNSLDVMQVLLYVSLCEEDKGVPAEYEVATALWYVRTLCLPGPEKF